AEALLLGRRARAHSRHSAPPGRLAPPGRPRPARTGPAPRRPRPKPGRDRRTWPPGSRTRRRSARRSGATLPCSSSCLRPDRLLGKPEHLVERVRAKRARVGERPDLVARAAASALDDGRGVTEARPLRERLDEAAEHDRDERRPP